MDAITLERVFLEGRLQLIRDKIGGKHRPDQIYHLIEDTKGVLSSNTKDEGSISHYRKQVEEAEKAFSETYPSFSPPYPRTV